MDDNNYLISVSYSGKIIELYYSYDLRELGTIRAMHRCCEIEARMIKEPENPKPEYMGNQEKGKITRNGRPWANRVQCVETGEIWQSVIDCSCATGLPSWAIYKSVHKGYTAFGRHFRLLPPIDENQGVGSSSE